LFLIQPVGSSQNAAQNVDKTLFEIWSVQTITEMVLPQVAYQTCAAGILMHNCARIKTVIISNAGGCPPKRKRESAQP